MSSTGRLGSLSLLTDTMRDVGNSQTKLAELQNQISSGRKSQDFEGLNGNVENFTQLNSQLNRADQFQDNNAVNTAKLQTADAALAKIVDIADKLKNTMMGANSATINTAGLPQILEDLLSAFGSELNTTFNGHYIFGGTNTANIPVPSTGVLNNSAGSPDDNYYVGSKQDATMRADERTDITFPVRADDEAFQKIYAAARLAVAAAKAGDATTMQAAQQMVQDGQSGLIAARSRVGASVVSIQNVNERLTSLKTYWTELSDSISKTDIVAASTEVASYQAILQASFQVYARLSQLRLSDYLK